MKQRASRDSDWLSAAEACEVLGIKRQTLYAYVSRGRIRARPAVTDPRCSVYSRHDIDALVVQRGKPRARAAVAAGAIDFGEPVLDSAISTVRDGQLYFGSEAATHLAESASLEDVARHHWRVAELAATDRLSTTITGRDPRTRGYAMLAELAPVSPASVGRTRHALAMEADALLDGFAHALIGRRRRGLIHERLATHWRVDARGADTLRRALVLISDHELNPSTFAVRIAASTGAPLAAAALAGLATLDGPLHGGATLGAWRFLSEAIARRNKALVVSEDTNTDGRLIWFGHPLYPDGDPRARHIVDRLPKRHPVVRAVRLGERVSGMPANVDTALSALGIALGLPRHASFMLFALGRMAGWLAHAIEQVESGRLIRPRARFTEMTATKSP